MALQLKTKLAEELKQKEIITNNLVNKILYSKRLLVDHVESLEHCLKFIQMEKSNEDAVDNNNTKAHSNNGQKILDMEIFTARNTCLLVGSTMLEKIIIPRSLRILMWPSVLICTGFSTLYVIKKVFVCRNAFVEQELNNLINVIDDFGNCIRRNMTYFNEIIIMKQHELIESRQIERAWDCITAAKEVTEILYDATRKLEAQYPLPAKFKQYYSPMEELRECEYFKNNITDYSPKQIKDFHNIFAYVQSQFLLRLALTVLTKPSISTLNAEMRKINTLIRQWVQEEEQHFKNLAIELNEKKQMEIDELNATKIMQNRSGPVAVLQDSSLKLNARMLAVAGECQTLDVTLQRLNEMETKNKANNEQLLQVAKNMRSIESALSVCFDDFQRLMLVYNKFLSSRLDALNAKNTESAAICPEKERNDADHEMCKQNGEENVDEPMKDDFYAYMYDEREAELEQASRANDDVNAQEREILNFEKRITKGKFRPVLHQLKDRIDPIRKVMLEKEREVLAAKGFNLNDLLANDKSADNENNDDSDDSADMEFERRNKELHRIKEDQFEEMRKFLAQKQAINLFRLDLTETTTAPPAALVNEEVIESEC